MVNPDVAAETVIQDKRRNVMQLVQFILRECAPHEPEAWANGYRRFLAALEYNGPEHLAKVLRHYQETRRCSLLYYDPVATVERDGEIIVPELPPPLSALQEARHEHDDRTLKLQELLDESVGRLLRFIEERKYSPLVPVPGDSSTEIIPFLPDVDRILPEIGQSPRTIFGLILDVVEGRASQMSWMKWWCDHGETLEYYLSDRNTSWFLSYPSTLPDFLARLNVPHTPVVLPPAPQPVACEYEVFRFLLQAFEEREHFRSPISSRTTPALVECGFYGSVKCGKMSEQTLTDFLDKNNHGHELDPSQLHGWPVVPQTEIEAVGRDIEPGDCDAFWDRFHKRFPESHGIIKLGRVGFSKNGSQALAHISHTSGSLAGDGRTLLLRKADCGWEETDCLSFWVS